MNFNKYLQWFFKSIAKINKHNYSSADVAEISSVLLRNLFNLINNKCIINTSNKQSAVIETGSVEDAGGLEKETPFCFKYIDCPSSS